MNMADFQTVDTSGFDESIAAFSKALQTYVECRDQFSLKTKNLLANWEGKASDEFNASYTKIQRSLSDNVYALSDIISNLETIRLSYVEWDDTAATKIENAN